MTVERSPSVELPQKQPGVPQDEEWCFVRTDSGRQRIRFHDYGRIYDIPGLYEALFHDELNCASPETVSRMLGEAMDEEGFDPDTEPLRILELGAGNGVVGQRLRDLGADELVGVDVIPEARSAARRDRPGLYDDYIVDDLADARDETEAALDRSTFDALVTVAALGFDDLPPRAFAAGYNAIEVGGWVAFNIKDRFLSDSDDSGYGGLIGEMVDSGIVRPVRRERYVHRLSMTGTPLHYVAFVGRKLRPISEATLDRCA